MALKPSQPILVAVDTNVALDYANGRDVVVDAIATIRSRLRQGALCVPPTAAAELAHAADRGETPDQRAAATRFLRQHRAWHFQLVNFVPVGHGIAERIADRLRETGLLPPGEVHDSLVAAEAALLDCSILLTSDEHLRGMDYERLSVELQAFDVAVPLMATPSEIVRKFFR
jgi:predicted nucleic acid-binding protein